MKLFLWKNYGAESDFLEETNINMDDVQTYSSNHHDGGIVVQAESKESAINFVLRLNPEANMEALKEVAEVENKEGIVLYCDGAC